MKTLSKTTVGLLAAVSLLVAAPAFAQDGATRIGVVNVQTIMRDSGAAKSIRDQLEAKQKSIQGEISKKEESLRKEDQELASQRAALAKEAFEAKVKAFQQKVTENQKDVQGKKASFDRGVEEALGQAQKAMTDVVSEIAKEKGFQVVITNAQAPYYDASLDITADVLSRMNQRLPKVDVKFSAAPAAEAPKKSDKK